MEIPDKSQPIFSKKSDYLLLQEHFTAAGPVPKYQVRRKYCKAYATKTHLFVVISKKDWRTGPRQSFSRDMD